MGGINTKYQNILKALTSFQDAIDHYNSIQKTKEIILIGSLDRDELLLSLRDSMVQRFEYSLDTFWKYLKIYLEEKEKVVIEFQSPRYIINTACKVGLITEKETEEFLEMLEGRNLTSHIYKEEIAKIVAQSIPAYSRLLQLIAARLKP